MRSKKTFPRGLTLEPLDALKVQRERTMILSSASLYQSRHSMKASLFVTITALLLLAFVQSVASSAKHAQFFKQAQSAPDKILDLQGAQDFDDLIASPRDYSISMLLTAVDSGVQCGPCLAFQPTYKNLANSFAGLKKEATSRHLFANLEFKNGRDVFQKVRSLDTQRGSFTVPTESLYPLHSLNCNTLRCCYSSQQLPDHTPPHLAMP